MRSLSTMQNGGATGRAPAPSTATHTTGTPLSHQPPATALRQEAGGREEASKRSAGTREQEEDRKTKQSTGQDNTNRGLWCLKKGEGKGIGRDGGVEKWGMKKHFT